MTLHSEFGDIMEDFMFCCIYFRLRACISMRAACSNVAEGMVTMGDYTGVDLERAIRYEVLKYKTMLPYEGKV